MVVSIERIKPAVMPTHLVPKTQQQKPEEIRNEKQEQEAKPKLQTNNKTSTRQQPESRVKFKLPNV